MGVDKQKILSDVDMKHLEACRALEMYVSDKKIMEDTFKFLVMSDKFQIVVIYVYTFTAFFFSFFSI